MVVPVPTTDATADIANVLTAEEDKKADLACVSACCGIFLLIVFLVWLIVVMLFPSGFA